MKKHQDAYIIDEREESSYDTGDVTRWYWKIDEFASDEYLSEANAIDALRRESLIFTKVPALHGWRIQHFDGPYTGCLDIHHQR